jgi:hypothetical protein
MRHILPILFAASMGSPVLADSPLPAGCWMGPTAKFAVQVWSAPPSGKLHLSMPASCFYTLGDKLDGQSYSLSAQSCTELDKSLLTVKANGDGFDFTIVKLGIGGTLTRHSEMTDEKSCHIK